jgi:hypothetical protein
MTIVRDSFATGVYHDDKQYTPQQVIDYIEQTSGEEYGDPQKIDALKEQSQAQVQVIVDEQELALDQILQRSTSEAGKALSDLILKHCDEVIELIVEGGHEKGIMI